MPIQIKGTETVIQSDIATFSCSVEDLRNYYYDGGCVFFLISVNPSSGDSKIFYSSLLVYDLRELLDKAGKQKTKTIKLTAFPSEDINEISTIFISFIENSRKQTSFIGKELSTLEQLEKRGVDIESLTFNASGMGLNWGNIGDFISSHSFYLYAKPKGLDIEIPVEKVEGAICSRHVNGKVCVKDVEFYPSYLVISEKGNSWIQIGKGISISSTDKDQKITLSFNASGTLSDYILDGKCFISVVENEEISLNGARLPFHNIDDIDLNSYKEQLHYYEDVKKMLDILGVTEELQMEKLSIDDETNIRNFVNAILYNKKIGFTGVDDSTIQGSFRIANLSIWILSTKKDDGYYQIESFFAPHQIAFFADTDSEQENPILGSQFLLLGKDAFMHTSNMDYERIKTDIGNMEHNPLLTGPTTNMLLEMLRGYDLQTNKDAALLDLAEYTCNWLADNADANGLLDSQTLMLNQLQIKKRKRNFLISEITELAKLTEESNTSTIRCGAYLLLGDIENAQICFNELPPEMQREFMTYPICHFGALTIDGGKQ